MPSGSRFAVWDVVTVGFPYADEPKVRLRPTLVIAAPEVHARFSVLWVLMVTTAARGAWPGDVAISDPVGAGLSVPCYIRTEKVATVDIRLAEAVGRLAIDDRREVVDRLCGLLGPILRLQH